MSDRKIKVNTQNHWFVWRLFRDEFREWYGMVSVLELASNRAIITRIQKIEKLLAEALRHGT